MVSGLCGRKATCFLFVFLRKERKKNIETPIKGFDYNKTVSTLALLTEVTIGTWDADVSQSSVVEKEILASRLLMQVDDLKKRPVCWVVGKCQWFECKREERSSWCTAPRRGWWVGNAAALAQLVLVLLPEAVSSWEEVPASFLIHLPHIRLLKTEKQNTFE